MQQQAEKEGQGQENAKESVLAQTVDEEVMQAVLDVDKLLYHVKLVNYTLAIVVNLHTYSHAHIYVYFLYTYIPTHLPKCKHTNIHMFMYKHTYILLEI